MAKLVKVKEIRALTGLTGAQIDYFQDQKVVIPAGTYTYSVKNRSGYRQYRQEDIPKFQQIAMYYELGLPRNEIRDIMTAKNYNPNKALDDLYRQLEEKQERLERYKIAIKHMRMLGANGDLPAYMKGIDGEKLGRDYQRLLTLPAWKELETLAPEIITDEGIQVLQDKLHAYAALSCEELENEGPEAIAELMGIVNDQLGVLGFVLMAATAIAVPGEGTLSIEMEEELDVKLSKAHAEGILAWIKKDLTMFYREMLELVVKYHNFIGGDYDNEQIKNMVDDVMELIKSHLGIQREIEYQLMFELIPPKPMKDKKDYFSYIYSAVHHYYKK